MFWIIGIIVIIVLILIFWIIGAQRKLVHTDELCGNSLSQIGVQQSSRWDALHTLAKLTKSYSEHEYNTLMATIGQRKPIGGNNSAEEADAQENMIEQTLSKIIAIAEAYPDLKAQETYVQTMQSVDKYENNVRMSRMVYNDSVTKYNRLTRQLPTSIVAGLFNFRLRDYLEADPVKESMPDLDI